MKKSAKSPTNRAGRRSNNTPFRRSIAKKTMEWAIISENDAYGWNNDMEQLNTGLKDCRMALSFIPEVKRHEEARRLLLGMLPSALDEPAFMAEVACLTEWLAAESAAGDFLLTGEIERCTVILRASGIPGLPFADVIARTTFGAEFTLYGGPANDNRKETR